MTFIRIKHAEPLSRLRVRLTLTDGASVTRNLERLLVGPAFDAVRGDPLLFRQVKPVDGTIAWPNGADLCPDTVIWGGPPPAKYRRPEADLTPTSGQDRPAGSSLRSGAKRRSRPAPATLVSARR